MRVWLVSLIVMGCAAPVSGPDKRMTVTSRQEPCDVPSPYLSHFGTAETLRGRVLTVSVFTSDAHHSWEEHDKQRMLSLTRTAQEFLLRESKAWEVELSFANHEIGLDRDVRFSLPPDVRGYSHRSWVREMLRSRDVGDLEAWVDGLRAKYGADQVHIVVFPKTRGRSYAMPYDEGVASWEDDPKEDAFDDELEATIVYAERSFGSAQEATTIAHEILHLYGARDLYESPRFGRERYMLARIHHQRDIMHTTGNIWTLEIQGYTAWLLGWTQCRRPWFDTLTFDPPSGTLIDVPSGEHP